MPRLFDLDEFCLLFAANMMGGAAEMKAKFEAHLASSARRGSLFPFYWRSPLLVKEIEPLFLSDMSPSSPTMMTEDKRYEVIFVDVSISFRVKLPDDKPELSPISVAFGAFLRRPNNHDCFYLKSPPITTKFLHDHVDQHDVVLEETKSHVIAKQMAQAFIDLRSSQQMLATVKLEGEKSATCIERVDIPLCYEDGSETSNLTIINNTGPVCKLDPNVTSTWFSFILTKNDNHLSEEERKTDFVDAKEATDLLAMFQEWKQKASERLEAQVEAKKSNTSKERTTENNETNELSHQSPAKASARSGSPSIKCKQASPNEKDKDNKSKNKPKRPKIHHGMARLGATANKRKKPSNPFGPAKK